MSAKHTPGPWDMTFEHGSMSGGTISRGSDVIAEVYGSNNGAWRDADDDGESEFEANARLIAAAPDLLDALKVYMHAMEGFAEAVRAVTGTAYPWEAQDIERAKALAALSKAEGK